MTAQIIDGKALAKTVRHEVGQTISKLSQDAPKPGLAVVLVGEDPASQVYVRHKERAAKEVGVEAIDIKRPESTTTHDLLSLISELNTDPKIHGILVQLPLPKHIDEKKVLDSISPFKDVDGFHPENIGLLAQGRPRYVAATPKGCMRLIREHCAEIQGKKAVVVGRSNIVGKPMAMLLTEANATVTLCHSKTMDLPKVCSEADILIAAVGRPEFIKGEWLKTGSTVIDVGINRDASSGKLIGDVEYNEACKIAGAITPVPGGVGPMTIASLLENLLLAYNVSRA